MPAPSNPTPAPLTAAELDELDRLHREATPGPWSTAEQGGGLSWAVDCIEGDDTRVCLHDGYRDGFEVYADAALIAAARNALPALLALARKGLEAKASYERGYEAALKDRVLDVVRVERERDAAIAERDVLYDATRLSVIGMDVVRAAARMAADKDARVLLKANIEASDKLAAALAEVERLRGRLEKALLAIRLGFHTERFVVGDEGVTRYSCCGREYVCANPFVNDHEKNCKAIQLAIAVEAQAAQDGAARKGGEA